VAVPTGGLNISPDGKAITLEMKNVPVIDQPRWPALDAIVTPARMAFKMVEIDRRTSAVRECIATIPVH